RFLPREEVPPHARGWPRIAHRPDETEPGSPARAGMARGTLRGRSPCIGSPARAGMAPTRASASPPPTRFPRTRGDGPPYFSEELEAERVPRTRGDGPVNLGAGRLEKPDGGSPARAGMAP